ncbi:hypothetical protein [[Clostridium] scindens]|uniref:hypothetical protein n=1 Tax=Clostridium scindens (strain JCM 10418 / VPI 12708) TaxID=29347 RepID=UPI0022E5358D|nr:hypothetical protein [[Clostridium] scindens]WPB21895.1 hypothetical protein GAFPHCNK_01355 [[Clostridium] scindens]WPB33111.1 hypothetical protein HCEICBPK_01881 [[Clostridium] scindens]WPB33866.1 hypothetical protein HCEICBPK_02639 [[Clostridium] scindens]WPB37104.1 hypothetical protein PBLEJBOC_01810 [[Clostridium] scindens]
MLNRYRGVEVCKADIKEFVNLVREDRVNIPNNDLVSIAKCMLFIKKMYAFPETRREHYYNCLVTDMFNLIHSFNKDSLRVYYTFFRSTIENLVRVVLGYENTNATGVRNMFKELRDRYEKAEKEFIDYLEGEYGKCCEVIHSNYNVNLTMYQYYEGIKKTDELDKEQLLKLSKQLVTFYRLCKQFLVKCNHEQINDVFHNQKEVLGFLLGKKDYECYLNYNE